MAYQQEKFISHSSGGWEIQDQGTSRFNVWWEPTFWFIDSFHFALSSQGSKGSKDLSGASFIRVLIPLKRSPPSGPNHLKALPPDTVTLGIRFQHRIFGERTHLVHSKCLPMNQLASSVTVFTDLRENSIASCTTSMTSWMPWHQARWFCASFMWQSLCCLLYTGLMMEPACVTGGVWRILLGAEGELRGCKIHIFPSWAHRVTCSYSDRIFLVP